MRTALQRAERERERYIAWLAERVDANLNYDGITFSKLVHILWDIPFMYVLERDAERGNDGNMLRKIYTHTHKIDDYDEVFATAYPTEDSLTAGCTFLEFLVAISERANDIMYDPLEEKTSIYFWQFLKNIGLDHCSDEDYGISWDYFYVSNVVGKVLNRNYEADGSGGLFPISNPTEDQRTVEIWYQLQGYLLNYSN